MAASFLISDCLETIFSTLLVKNPINYTYCYISTKDIYSCTLVSKHWCKISTPYLYAYPFHYFAYSKSHWNYYYEENPSYYKLIRTLLSCIPKSEIEQILISNSFNIQKLLPSYISATFNYIAFIHGIIFDKILLNINSEKVTDNQKIWLPPYIIINDFQFSEISIPIMKYFVEYLCKHCDNLTTLDFPFAISNDDLSDNIINLLTFNYDNGINKLTNLKELSCVYNEVFNEDINKDSGKLPKDIYLALSNNICNLNLLYNESMGPPFANSLSKFISLQKNLQYIILSETKYSSIFCDYFAPYKYNVSFNSLSTQSKSLQVLDFRYFDFSGINEEALNSLFLLKNIKKLKLNNCKIYYNLNYWAKNLTKLEVLEFYDNDISLNSAKFLTQLFQSSPNTLTKLILNYNKINAKHSSKLTQQIPLYLHSLIHLELRIITIDQLINIFKSCIELTYLNVALSGKKNFKDLGKFIPKSLQKIRFGNLLFKSNELKFFLEECVNNDSKLKYIEIVNCAIKDKYFDVVKEFDVKLIKVSTS